LGFEWEVKPKKWSIAFNHLVYYKMEYGDCLVPSTFKTKSGFKLGSWVSVQRKEAASLSPDRVSRLNELGFAWDAFIYKWETAYQALEAYKNKFGDCLVPRRHTTDNGLNLGSWVVRQRMEAASLSPDRISRLNELGFIWNVK
jgi:hypothetical protein